MKNGVVKNLNKRGISLIVLIITIIVIIILAAAVILTLTGNNPIENAKQAQFENDLDTFKSELDIYKAQEYATTQGNFLPKELFATQTNMTYNGELQIDKTMFNVITSLKGKIKYENKFEIIEGKLCYIGTNNKEKEWAPLADVEVLNDEPKISITALNTLPIRAGVKAKYSVNMLCGIPITVQTISNSNIKVLNNSDVELVPQPSINSVITGSEYKKTAEVEINTTGISEGVYKLKVLENTVQTSTTGNEETIGTGTFEIDNDAPNMPTIEINPSIATSGDVTVTLGGKPDNTYKLEYSTDGINWTIYTVPIILENNLTIYAKLTNLANSISEEMTMEINNIDKVVPENATLNVSSSEDTLNGTLTLTDNLDGTGIELSQSKYMITAQSTAYSIDSAEWNTATTFSANPQNISVTKTDGDYYVHTLSVDKAGNKRSNISAKVTIANLLITDPGYVSSKGVNGPVLVSGMTPIKWDTSGNLVPTNANDSNWYNYSTKQWANAQTEDGSMWVWIPRYEYDIPTINEHTQTAGTININFLNNTSGAVTSGYIVHPAFTFGDQELKGIWVAKFEASGTNSTIKSISGVLSMKNISISSIFTACRNMETINGFQYGWGTSGIGIDTHLTKNIEWGAAAYLGQSNYGKNSEVWINPNSTKTGQAGTSVNSASTTSTYPYNNLTYGINASTSGTVYGIYDMNGGTYEYTAAYVNNGNSNLTTNGSSLLNAENKYKDIYVSSGDTQGGNYDANSTKKGDAFYETSSYAAYSAWFLDGFAVPYSTWPFFFRGGFYNGSTSSGTFTIGAHTGAAMSLYGFRPSLVISAGI